MTSSLEATQAVNSGDPVDQAWAKFIIVHQCSFVDTESCPAVTGGNSPNINRANVAQGRSGSVCWVYSVSHVIEEQRTPPEQLLLDFPTDDVTEVLNL